MITLALLRFPLITPIPAALGGIVRIRKNSSQHSAMSSSKMVTVKSASFAWSGKLTKMFSSWKSSSESDWMWLTVLQKKASATARLDQYVHTYIAIHRCSKTPYTLFQFAYHTDAVSFEEALSVCNQWALTTSSSAPCGHNDSKTVITLYNCFQGDGDGFHPWTFSHLISGLLELNRDWRLQMRNILP